jgi:uncharacterized membrane protein
VCDKFQARIGTVYVLLKEPTNIHRTASSMPPYVLARAQQLAQTAFVDLQPATRAGKKAAICAIAQAKALQGSAPKLIATGFEVQKNSSSIVQPVIDKATAILMYILQVLKPYGESLHAGVASIWPKFVAWFSEHPIVIISVGSYTLISAIFGSLWPLAVLLRIIGFARQGVILGEFCLPAPIAVGP